MDEGEIRIIAGNQYGGVKQFSFAELTERIADGLKAGMRMYAHWEDGRQYVGTTGKALQQALADVDAALLKVQKGQL